MAFLSLLDSRAKPKGSRDPLGFEQVWTYFGRKVVGNLTTITSSVENFAVALLGFHWANQLNAHLSDEDRHKAIRHSFLRYEQVAGYLRKSHPNSVMGILRVTQRFEDAQIPLGITTEAMILSDQVSYGLWGLYSDSMRNSGLVEGSDRLITPRAKEIAELIESHLDVEGLKSVLNKKYLNQSDIVHYSNSFYAAVNDKKVVDELVNLLLTGTDSKGIQAELWQHTQALNTSGLLPTERKSWLGEFITRIQERDISPDLRSQLTKISDVERVLVAINNILQYLRSQNGCRIEELVTKLVEQAYSYEHLPTILPTDDFPRKSYIEATLAALKSNDYQMAIDQILELNKVVMLQRGGAPWLNRVAGGLLSVKVPTEGKVLLTQLQLESNWDYDYFLSSYLTLATRFLKRDQHG